MLSKFEKSVFDKEIHTSLFTYKNLNNLPHWHLEHEIIYVTKGVVELSVNNATYRLLPKMCAFVRSEDIHFLKGTEDSITHVIKTDAKSINNILKHKRLASPVLKKEYEYDKIINTLKKELKNKNEYANIIIDSIVTCFTAEIFRSENFNDLNSLPDTHEKHKELLEWLSQNYANVTFDEAADYMNFSKPYFSKYFQKFSGLTFTQYINTLKVASAIEKIATGKMNITQISISCGFNTIRNFNRVFKSLTGYTPKTLPEDFVFMYRYKANDGFNPTLKCSEIIE